MQHKRRTSERPELDDDDNQRIHEEEAREQQERAREMNRQSVVREICVSEARYVENVKMLIKGFVEPMEDERLAILTNPTVAVFFQNLKQIYTVNSQLLEECHQASDTPNDSIGALFSRYARLFRPYAEYAKNFNEVAQLFQRQRSTKFAAFINQCQAQCGCVYNFESLLITPVQRVPRYKLLLERVVEYTAQTHSDQPALLEAVKAVSDAAQLINETVRQKENMEEVLKVQAQFQGQLSLFTLDRRLLYSGVLIKISTKREERVMLHLFNDMLLYSDILPAKTYHCRRSVDFASAACGIDEELPDTFQALFTDEKAHLHSDCAFKVNSAEKSFVLLAPSVEEKKKWVELIATAIATTQSSIVPENSFENPAAVWIPDGAVESCSLCQRRFGVSFRRHHCRRCGNVVCGNCSTRRAIVIDNDPNEKRVCDKCFPILNAVRKCALKWLSCLIEFKGVLFRLRKRRWIEYYYELKGGVLKQYTLDCTQSLSTDTMAMAGAIIIRNVDKYGKPNCFKITSRDAVNQLYKMSPLKAYTKRMLKSNSLEQSEQEWVLSATCNHEWSKWIDALDTSANKAIARTSIRSRRSIDTSGSNLSLRDTEMSDHDLTPLIIADSEETKQERYRHEILKEIVRSEQSYVECLGECIRVFVQPLLLRQLEGQKLESTKQGFQRRISQLSHIKHEKLHRTFTLLGITKRTQLRNTGSSILPLESLARKSQLDATMAVFFTSMDQIFILNQQLLDHLKRHLAETESLPNSSIHCIGAIFNAYAPLFQMYASYASHHESALSAIESDDFVSILARIQLKMDIGTLHKLRAYLNMPMERIPKYKVFLEEVLACTDECHVDYPALLSSVQKVNHVVHCIQETLVARECKRKLKEVEVQYGIKLRRTNYIKGGILRKVCRGTVKNYHVVLLNHALLYAPTGLIACYQKKHKIIELAGASAFKMMDSLPESVLQAISPRNPDFSNKNAFYFRSSRKSFLLVADTEEGQQEWVSKIQEAIYKVDFNHRLSSNSEDDEKSPHAMDMFMRKPIKSGWLQVKSAKKKWKKQWVTVDYHHFTIGNSFQTCPEVTLVIVSCNVQCLTGFPTQFEIKGDSAIDTLMDDSPGYEIIIEAGVDRDEWIRAISHCIESGSLEGSHVCLSAISEPAQHFAPVLQFHNSSKKCMLCSNNFTLYRLRHHCRNCGTLVCSGCSKSRVILSHHSPHSVRVCDLCMDEHTAPGLI